MSKLIDTFKFIENLVKNIMRFISLILPIVLLPSLLLAHSKGFIALIKIIVIGRYDILRFVVFMFVLIFQSVIIKSKVLTAEKITERC